ncbi:Fpg/Nei family DNA glycosylase [Tsukamurella sp. 8F]|uniref:DNA-formamidopyrimidine glycosylase family protein n=1 Tax=unclassified Tsukamurella TaxID=2633480 RepID=UPI0023B8FACC|nr:MULTISPECIES: DNA-formamidopyrimidine glycosylase family protein [unclassified Tsukamurella]MDF0532199.1 Fpg/Nei family DNA glycosylase [Tsukamurella sp. 8J]MDF0589238.1 Fpg/Nei family DNA glycosylase [Tsukamurella sp. 8F]
MPEGDTVFRSARRLHEALAGRELTRCDLRVPRYATVDLSGRTVDEVRSRGKHLLMRVGDSTIHSHLKMEGVWHVYHRGERWRRPAHTARAVLAVGDIEAVGFSLGLLEVVARAREDDAVGPLGPDLLGRDWDPGRAAANLAVDPRRAVGLALLDQRVMAGIGNEYRSEICFLRGVAPQTPVADAGDPAAWVDLAHRLLVANRDRLRRTTTGVDRDGARLWVYGRDRRPCRRCGTAIRSAPVGSNDGREADRTAWWCSVCQR